jgi:hypothetical protein
LDTIPSQQNNSGLVGPDPTWSGPESATLFRNKFLVVRGLKMAEQNDGSGEAFPLDKNLDTAEKVLQLIADKDKLVKYK